MNDRITARRVSSLNGFDPATGAGRPASAFVRRRVMLPEPRTRKPRRKLVLLGALLAVCFTSSLALFAAHAAPSGIVLLAQAKPTAAASFIDLLGQRVIKSLTRHDVTAQQRAREFRALLRESFDLPYIGRFTLARYWRRSTVDQRVEFLRLFEDFIVQAYAYRFKDYAGETLVVDHSLEAANGTFYVRSHLVRASRLPILINWRVRRSSIGFKVIDVIVEGISMLVTQRDEFASVILNSGGRVEGLLAALRKRTAGNRRNDDG